MPTKEWQSVYQRVNWWLNDMAFKPPEVLTDHYYECMATDIADWATGETSKPSAMDRLDPPRKERIER